MASALSTGIIILKDHVVNPLASIARVGRYNRLAKRVNKISFR